MRSAAPRLGPAALAVLLVAGLLGALGAPGQPAAAAAADTFCGLDGTPGLTTYRWVGGGNGSWDDPDNWQPSGVPGVEVGLDEPHVDESHYACIDAGENGVVTVPSGLNAVQLQAFDVADGTTLRLSGGKLFTHGDPATRPSVVRGRLELVNAYLGGSGRIRVDGRMRISTDPGVSTLTSDSCAAGTPTGVYCAGLAGAGELEISAGGWLDVNGAFGIQLRDGYALDVRGLMSLTGTGSFVSADRGTAVTVAPGGTLKLANDGGIYEGSTRQAGDPLATLTNAGTVTKTAGTGASALDVTYRRVGSGRIVVSSGTITLPDGASAVTLAAGRTFGTGSCRAGVLTQCKPGFTADDREYARLRPTTPVTGAGVTEGTTEQDARDVAPPVTYRYRGRPGTVVRVDLDYARELVAGARLDAYWSATRTGTYRKVRDCGRRGAFPGAAKVCVAERIRHRGGARTVVVRARTGGSLVTR